MYNHNYIIMRKETIKLIKEGLEIIKILDKKFSLCKCGNEKCIKLEECRKCEMDGYYKKSQIWQRKQRRNARRRERNNNNIEEVRKKRRQYYNDNIDVIREKNRQRNKLPHRQEYSKQKHDCLCGGKYTTTHKNKHMLTQKHILYEKTLIL